MKVSTLKSNITSIVKANDESNLHAVICNCVYQSLVHGNILPTQMKAVRDSKANPKFKAALNKYMPMTWRKAGKTVKTPHYEFSSTKQEELRLALGITKDSTLEQVTAAMPVIFEKKAPAKQYNRAEYLASVAKKLTKEGEADVDSIIALTAALLAQPQLVEMASKAIFSDAAKKLVKAA